MKIEIKKLPKSEIEIEGELSYEKFKVYETKALKALGESAELPGFRKGHVPEKVLLEKISPIHFLEEMAELALADLYPNILEENKIDAIGRPQINITKLAKENPLGFKIITAVLPEVTLPDYKKISAKENKEKNVDEVNDEDIKKTINELRKLKALQVPHEHKEGEEHSQHEEVKEEDLPVFDDTFAQSFGNFKDAEEFTDKIRQNLKLEKEQIAKEKIRIKMIEEIIEKTKVEVPQILIDAELQKIFARLEADLSQAGISMPDYLKQINKTPEDLRNEWSSDAEKRAKLELILFKIAGEENLKPSDEDIEKEVAHLMTQYKEADPNRARAYVHGILINESVFKFLEEQE